MRAVGPATVEFDLWTRSARGGGSSPSRTRLRVEAIGETKSVIIVEEAGANTEVRRFWNDRLHALREVARSVGRRRKNPRQALIVVHGIGEQRPGATLRSLIDSAVLPDASDVDRWIKPDWSSRSYELRRATFKASAERNLPTTDVFEFYWAHMVRDTSFAQLIGWVRTLLLRIHVPPALRPAWVLAWLLVVGGVVVAMSASSIEEWWLGRGAIVAAMTVLYRFGRTQAVQVAGDAARYLVPHPGNVAQRQAIRDAGVELLVRLHESGYYDRIVILGHSLGSVVAYDLVTHAWNELHQRHEDPDKTSFKAIADIERNLEEQDASSAQELQAVAWRELRRNTQPWLVTDLVTVGSPLAHASYLMARSIDEFERAKTERSLPSCPPVSEHQPKSGHEKIAYNEPYQRPVDAGTARRSTFTLLHHAAPFAVTRWTNLYFKTAFLGLQGDLIGGPVAPQFGPWVRDIPLPSPIRGFAHTRYWAPGEGDEPHIGALRRALALESRAGLQRLLRELPPGLLTR